MALETKFIMSLRKDGQNIKFSDTAGDYNASTNPTGWGAPNPAKGDVIAASLVLYAPNSDFSVGDTTATVDVLALGYPLTTDIDIPLASVGWASGSFPDGAIQGVLTVTTTGPVTHDAYTWVAAFRNALQCCADALVAPYRPCECGASTIKKRIENMQLDLYSISRAEDVQDIPSMVDALDHGSEVCSKSSNCKSCGC